MNSIPLALRRHRQRVPRARALPPAIALGLALALTLAPTAPATATTPGDAAAGKTLHEKDCVACHARKFGGDATKIYLRADRKVTTPAKLKAQIAMCNTELGTGYFPEEEDHLAAYLELSYYKFK